MANEEVSRSRYWMSIIRDYGVGLLPRDNVAQVEGYVRRAATRMRRIARSQVQAFVGLSGG